MAENGRNSTIVFDNVESVHVQSTIKQIDDALHGVTNPAIPLILVIDELGAELWINANHIREIREFAPA